mgnify:CR=1 FL=1
MVISVSNRDPFLDKPSFEMGIPIPKWGFTYPHFEIGLVQLLIQFGSLGGESSIWNISKLRSQFQNSDPHTVMGRETQKLEIGDSKINILNTPYFHKQLNDDFFAWSKYFTEHA